MIWKTPHITKVYEALGAIGDERILVSDNSAKVYSSSRNKYYDVGYSPIDNAIMSNDNSSYWKDELGYPSIALLIKLGVLPNDQEMPLALKDIAWKDINQKYKNDFDKTMNEVDEIIETRGYSKSKLHEFCNLVLNKIEAISLVQLGGKRKPPEGY